MVPFIIICDRLERGTEKIDLIVKIGKREQRTYLSVFRYLSVITVTFLIFKKFCGN